MDAISYSYADKQAKRIKNFNENPDSTSGILTQPSVIQAGETVNIPAGRTAIMANTVIDGTVNIDGIMFIPSGATTNDIDAQLALKSSIVLGTAVNATGTSIDFTGIPSWVKKFTVMFNGVSTNGATTIRIILGTSSGLVVSGYAGLYGYSGNAGTYNFNHGNSFGIFHDTPGDLVHGSLNFSLVNNLTQAWVCNGIMSWSTRTYSLPTSGSVTLSGTLDRIRISTVNGTDTFDAGQINIIYEG